MPLQSGHLAGGSPAANNEIKYQCVAPAVAAAFTASFCNKTAGPVRVRLSHGVGANAAAGAIYWEYDTIIQANEVLERTGLATTVGRNVFASADTVGVDISIYGFEKG